MGKILSQMNRLDTPLSVDSLAMEFQARAGSGSKVASGRTLRFIGASIPDCAGLTTGRMFGPHTLRQMKMGKPKGNGGFATS
jgi:hypothetical protein